MRAELFEHYQKLSFGFYDDKDRPADDPAHQRLFALSELYHHGPEDIVIATLKFVGHIRHSAEHQCRS